MSGRGGTLTVVEPGGELVAKPLPRPGQGTAPPGAGWRRAPSLPVLLFLFLLAIYLATGGGKGYSVDGAFGYEMAVEHLLRTLEG